MQKNENSISRKFTISVIAILVLILATNNFGELTGQPVKPIVKCIDDSDIYKAGGAHFSDWSRVASDSCANTKTLKEATCTSGVPRTELATCSNGCSNNACLRTPAKRAWW